MQTSTDDDKLLFSYEEISETEIEKKKLKFETEIKTETEDLQEFKSLNNEEDDEQFIIESLGADDDEIGVKVEGNDCETKVSPADEKITGSFQDDVLEREEDDHIRNIDDVIFENLNAALKRARSEFRIKEIYSKYLNGDAENTCDEIKINNISQERISDLYGDLNAAVENTSPDSQFVKNTIKRDAETSENSVQIKNNKKTKTKRCVKSRKHKEHVSVKFKQENDGNRSIDKKAERLKSSKRKPVEGIKNDNIIIKSMKSRTRENRNICDICGVKIGSWKNFLLHVEKHMRIGSTQKGFYLCQLCGKGFGHKQTLDCHIRYLHTGERPYKCDFENCDKAFISPAKAKKHKETVHLNLRRYQCKDCPLSFKTKGALSVHRHYKHSPESQKVCPICDEFFATPSDLKYHIESHTDPTVLVCKICSKQFKKKCTLDKHVIMHRKKELSELCKCADCGKEFSRKSYLVEHQWKHTGNVLIDKQKFWV